MRGSVTSATALERDQTHHLRHSLNSQWDLSHRLRNSRETLSGFSVEAQMQSNHLLRN